MSSTLTQSTPTDAAADTAATGAAVPAVETARMASTPTSSSSGTANEDEIPIPDVSHLVTEDDKPVDNLIQEKLQRFLVECLYSSLKLNVPFLATCDVGLFYGIHQDALAPDVMLSLGVSVPEDWSEKRKRSYFVWEFGKPPDVAIEIVSNKKGGELDTKLQNYARAGVTYYVVFDPLEQLSPQILQIYGLYAGRYQRLHDTWLESVGLGLTVWEGEFETKQYRRWLRWCDAEGNLLLTGDEQARQERQRAEQAEQQLEQTEQQLERERQRAERLAALLRAQNINPDP